MNYLIVISIVVSLGFIAGGLIYYKNDKNTPRHVNMKDSSRQMADLLENGNMTFMN